MSDPQLDHLEDEEDPGTPMADVATEDLADLGPESCGMPRE
jgi:hypothetical protein